MEDFDSLLAKSLDAIETPPFQPPPDLLMSVRVLMNKACYCTMHAKGSQVLIRIHGWWNSLDGAYDCEMTWGTFVETAKVLGLSVWDQRITMFGRTNKERMKQAEEIAGYDFNRIGKDEKMILISFEDKSKFTAQIGSMLHHAIVNSDDERVAMPEVFVQF